MSQKATTTTAIGKTYHEPGAALSHQEWQHVVEKLTAIPTTTIHITVSQAIIRIPEDVHPEAQERAPPVVEHAGDRQSIRDLFHEWQLNRVWKSKQILLAQFSWWAINLSSLLFPLLTFQIAI